MTVENLNNSLIWLDRFMVAHVSELSSAGWSFLCGARITLHKAIRAGLRD